MFLLRFINVNGVSPVLMSAHKCRAHCWGSALDETIQWSREHSQGQEHLTGLHSPGMLQAQLLMWEPSRLPETRLALVGIKALYGRIATDLIANEPWELVMELLLIHGRESTKDREPKILGLRVG